MKIVRVTKKCFWENPPYPYHPAKKGEEYMVLDFLPYPPAAPGRIRVDKGARWNDCYDTLPLDSVKIITLRPITETVVVVCQGEEKKVGGKTIAQAQRSLKRSKTSIPFARIVQYTHYGRAPFPHVPWGSSVWVERRGKLVLLASNWDSSG